MQGTASRSAALGSGRPWELRLLGPPALAARDPDRVLMLRPKDAALLALVALAAPVKAEQVAALLWPAAGARQADASLRQRIFRLRRETQATLVGTGPLLQLAGDLATDLDAALARLREDEHAAAGELLADLDFDDLPELAAWLRAARRRWREQRLHALAEAAAASEQQGALARGLVYAQRLVDADPLAEHAHRRLMRLHYLRGDGAAAIAAFERLEQRLKDELGARPSAETIELVATIERAAARLPERRSVVPASLLRPPRLIGRETELERLHRGLVRRPRLPAQRRGRHRQDPPAAGLRGRPAGRGRGAGAAR
ncbi:MAG: bacterial transcriptional activator domain-containing protein [Rubrivivax sp.]